MRLLYITCSEREYEQYEVVLAVWIYDDHETDHVQVREDRSTEEVPAERGDIRS